MRTLQATLCTALLLSTANAQANNVWVVNLTDKPIQSATFLIFHKNSKAEIVGSMTKSGDIEKKEFKNIAPWSKTDGKSIDSTLSKLVVGKRGSKLCNVSIAGMKPSETIYIQGNPYQADFLFDCSNTPAFTSNLIVWGDCTLIVENDPSRLDKVTKKISRYKMKMENNSPYESKYLISKNDDKPIGNWATPKAPFMDHSNKKSNENTTNR